MSKTGINITTLFTKNNPEQVRLNTAGTVSSFLQDNKLFLYNLANATCTQLALPLKHHQSLVWHNWSVDDTYIIYQTQIKGDENWQLHLYKLSDATIRTITDEQSRTWGVSTSEHAPDTLYFYNNSRDKALFDLYTYTISTGTQEVVGLNDGTIKQWVLDATFTVRGVIRYTTTGEYTLAFFDNTEEKIVYTWPATDCFNTGPLGFCPNNTTYYFTAIHDGNDTSSLCSYNTITGEQKVLYTDATFDFAHTHTHEIITPSIPGISLLFNDNGTLSGFGILKEKMTWYSVDRTTPHPLVAHFMTQKAYSHFIISANRHKNFLVMRTNSITPPEWYIYTPGTPHNSRLLFSSNPALATEPLAPSKTVTITTRDQRTLNGYLYMPIGATQAPLILKIHGGPWGRNLGRFDADAQFFTSRGYAVLMTEYAASAGYGRTLMNAGNCTWGTTVLNDIEDVYHWACGQNIMSKKEVVLFGRSFGGYVALSLAALRGTLPISHIITQVAPVDLTRSLQEFPAYWQPFNAQLKLRMGALPDDYQLLHDHSPLHAVNNITAPVLICHSRHDIRVSAEHFFMLKAELKKYNKTFISCFFENEGHATAQLTSTIAYYQAIEQLLHENY